MIRKATIKDIKAIHGILYGFGNQGILLSRSLSDLYDHIRDFWVIDDPDDSSAIAGCCALQFCWEDIAEIRSLAVAEKLWGKDMGTLLVETAVKEAESYGIKNLFTLTYQPDFFKKFSFAIIDKSELPIKIWKDCIGCVKFPDCDETAMMRLL